MVASIRRNTNPIRHGRWTCTIRSASPQMCNRFYLHSTSVSFCVASYVDSLLKIFYVINCDKGAFLISRQDCNKKKQTFWRNFVDKYAVDLRWHQSTHLRRCVYISCGRIENSEVFSIFGTLTISSFSMTQFAGDRKRVEKIQIVSVSICRRRDLCESCENQILYALEVEQLKTENGKRASFPGGVGNGKQRKYHVYVIWIRIGRRCLWFDYVQIKNSM